MPFSRKTRYSRIFPGRTERCLGELSIVVSTGTPGDNSPSIQESQLVLGGDVRGNHMNVNAIPRIGPLGHAAIV